jgi:hypothetical protein
MPSALRDPKTLPDWFDPDYLGRARRSSWIWYGLLGGTLLLCFAGVALPLLLGKQTPFQAAPVAKAHASFNQDCSQCHVENFRSFDRLLHLDSEIRAVPDSACTRCHSGPIHQTTQIGERACASCHKEHRGHEPLARVADSHCTSCHADLQRNDGRASAFDPHIRGFAEGLHPEFRLFASGQPTDPGTVRFNHAVHLVEEGVWDLDREQVARQPGYDPSTAEAPRRRVRLDCQSCHKLDSTKRLMQPIRYEQHCQSCHPLGARLEGKWEGPRLRDLAEEFTRTPVPHPPPGGSAELLRGVVRERLTRFVLRAGQDGFLRDGTTVPVSDLLGPREDPALNREQFAWVNGRQTGVEKLLFDGPGGCRYCHQEKTASDDRPGGLPEYLPAKIPQRWFEHAVFNHQSHQMLACTECHPAALRSTRAGDVLLPAINTCLKCHGNQGQARSDCVECHTYHGHSGRDDFRGRLTIGSNDR